MFADRLRFSLAVIAFSALPLPAAAQCAGDCNGDGVVSINELIRGVNLALGSAATECAAADGNGDGVVRITDLIAAVNAALTGCVPNATATPTATATSTATATINQPPSIEVTGVYRSFPDEEIAYPLQISDPEGAAVECEATDLPAGASFDPFSAVLTWRPTDEQMGAYAIGLQCTDAGGAVAEMAVPLRIAPRSACAIPTCDAAAGCTTEPVAIDENCCAGEPEVRIPEPLAPPCPAGRMVRIGRNERGFGRIDDCHRLRLHWRGQASSGHVPINIEARCIDIDGDVRLHTRLETATRILVDSAVFLDALVPRDDGFVVERAAYVQIPTTDPRLVEGEEAQLTVRLIDASGAVATHSVRVVLTMATLPDLAELP